MVPRLLVVLQPAVVVVVALVVVTMVQLLRRLLLLLPQILAVVSAQIWVPLWERRALAGVQPMLLLVRALLALVPSLRPWAAL